MLKLIQKKYAYYGAAITVGMLSAVTDAQAAPDLAGKTNFTKISDNVGASISGLPGMVTGLAYLIGILLCVLGILKIKDHVENPANTPLKDGAIRLACGGALFAVPIVTEAMFATIDNGSGSTGAAVAKLNKIQFTVN
jgi:hypothetical protein